MAETDEEVQSEIKPPKAGMSTMSLVGIIAGVVALQAIIVFAVFKFFINAPDEKEADKKPEKAKVTHAAEEEAPDEEEEDITVRQVHTIVQTDDIIVNPKGSSTRYLMVKLGLEFEPEDKKEEVENKLMVPIYDRTLKLFSSYTVDELQRNSLRDSLKLVLKKDLKPYFGQEIKLRNIYFSKYIIQ